mmetsp:Transcript_3630/g.8229  ORF Transcript_3630/g.8229 Transcript_3630/m.8229 type:complete len:352 (+) Transcript_3630:67-1122(+)
MMSSRALLALKKSRGEETKGVNKEDAGSQPRSPGRTRTKRRGSGDDEATSLQRPLPPPFQSVKESYDTICFIFNIHANRERRSLQDLQEAFKQLSGRKIKVDDLRLIKTVYPQGISFSYNGLSSRPLSVDLMVQIPKEGGRKCFEKHKRNFDCRLWECAESADTPESIVLVDLPERGSNKRTLEECERIINKYKAEKVRGKARGESSAAEAEAEAGCSTEAQRRIPNFFKATKHISSRTIHMVENTQEKKRQRLEGFEALERRRNLAQLPKLFDLLRSLTLNRRAIPVKDVARQLVRKAEDKPAFEEQLRLLLSHAGEWCTINHDSKGNQILSINGRANPNKVRKALVTLT